MVKGRYTGSDADAENRECRIQSGVKSEFLFRLVQNRRFRDGTCDCSETAVRLDMADVPVP